MRNKSSGENLSVAVIFVPCSLLYVCASPLSITSLPFSSHILVPPPQAARSRSTCVLPFHFPLTLTVE